MWNSIKKFFSPHVDNGHHAPIWRKEGVILFLAVIFAIEGYFLLGSFLILNKVSFLASVFPNALVAFTNDVRENTNLKKLTESELLTKAAQLKADDMAARGYFSHYTPEGESPWKFLKEVGYAYNYAGENLAVNFSDSKDVVDAWVKSPTHYQNIIKDNYTEIGIATAEGEYKGKKTIFVVEFFGTRGSAPMVAAVTPSTKIAETNPVIAAKATTTAVVALASTTPVSTVAVESASTTISTNEPQVFGLEIDTNEAQKIGEVSKAKVPLFLSYPKHVVSVALVLILLVLAIFFVTSLRDHDKKHHGKIFKITLSFILVLLITFFFNDVVGVGTIL